MARRAVIEVRCDRCGAVWLEDANKPSEATSVELTITSPQAGKEASVRVVAFEVLCTKCAETVGNYVDAIDRDPEARRKPRAKKKAGKDGSATPPSKPSRGATGAVPKDTLLQDSPRPVHNALPPTRA